jgi:hypothetical protein
VDRLRHAVVIALLCVTGRAARAEHDHASHEQALTSVHRFEAGLGVIVASYRAKLYEGSYQGVRATAGWASGRVALSAQMPAYRIVRNGKPEQGLGDTMLHAHVRLFERGRLSGGGFAMVMLPTGSMMDGLGMGHVMVVPSAWVAWSSHDLALSGDIGYARGFGDASVHDDHAGGEAWPLVDPMTFSELVLSASALWSLGKDLRAGGRASVALPMDEGGDRITGGVRVAWSSGRVETTADIEAGFSCATTCEHGSPYAFRGVVASAVRF